MKRAILSVAAAAAFPLGACTTTAEDNTVASADTGYATPAGEAPAGYQTASATRCGPSVGRSAATGAVVGGATGAGAGALIGGVSVLEGAVIGAAVDGLAGAVWADSNNDGCADGYVREGQYYSGSPVIQPTNLAYTGERG